MSIPLRWAVNDRCAVRRDGQIHVGVVESLGKGCASVKIGEWRRVFCGLDELELVPFATASTLPAPADQDVGSAPVGSSPPGGGAADYSDFVSQKLTRAPSTGLAVVPELHASLFAFQKDLVAWALRRGRAALFADTGLGKTRMQLEWARHVAAATGGNVLILAPLAVAAQTAREGEQLGVPVTICRQGSDVRPGVNITNYDRLHRFDPTDFDGVVLDESSILKSFDGSTCMALIEAFQATPFRLAATATPSPNDFTELGTHAEFLGVCKRSEMLSQYFVNDSSATKTWRLKGHARTAFWRWIATWAALLRKPSDLGYPDGGYDLPELVTHHHVVKADEQTVKESGFLFAEPAKTLTERRGARKSSASERARRCIELVMSEPDEQWIVWGELNAETEALAKGIEGAIEVAGSHEPLLKEARLLDFAGGNLRVLVSKPRICGYGLNFQRCARMAFVGVSDSYEATYQAIRRCWRFKQTRPVHVHFFASELEGEVVKNLARKQREAEQMANELSIETRAAMRAEMRGTTRLHAAYRPLERIDLPLSLRST